MVINEAGVSLKTLSMVLSVEVESTLSLASTIVGSVVGDLLIENKLFYEDGETIHKVLMSHHSYYLETAETPRFSHMFIINSQGINIGNTVSYPVKKVDASDRAYFIHHKQTNNQKIYISKPLISKVTGERVIYLTKRINYPDGRFAGVIGIQLKLAHFDKLYQQLDLPVGGTVTMIHEMGYGIYRYPYIDSFFNESVKDRADFKQMLQTKNGYIQVKVTPFDKTERMVGYKYSETYPVISIVSVTQNTLLEQWLNTSIKTTIIAGIGGLFLLAVFMFTYKQIDVLAETIHLSSHDPLTMLWNRRAFEQRLEEEWRRAMRSEKQITILFIDIDFFKDYNDTYGHQAGDRALKLISNTFTKTIKRGGDMVARYGGEEFIVLLPDISAADANLVAERCLTAVKNLKITHKSSKVAEDMTISIGVATVIPVIGDNTESIIKMADEALYQAKESGRNRIIAHKDILV
jgi:diguanylate cyclase (GGDEF)-like protein